MMSRKHLYGSSTIKRKRRTRAEMAHLDVDLLTMLCDDHPQTVRGVFYQATVRGTVEKTEAGYRTVQRALLLLRESGQLPFSYITDSTRLMRKPSSYSNIGEALDQAEQYYRRALWDDQDAYVEFWIEKDAVSGVAYEVTSHFDVPLMVARGFSSLTFLHGSADYIRQIGKPCFIYHLGDYDPSGVSAALNIEKGLRKYAPDATIHFERLAVTPEQITEWDLPSRPTKTTDTRAKGFDGDSVELDAIPAWRLKELIQRHIEAHIDPDVLEVTRTIEAAERKSFTNLRQAWGGVTT